MMNSLRAGKPHVTFQEVPDEVSLTFLVGGCPLQCPGCHSQESWSLDFGEILSNELFSETLDRYRGLITCVVFFGGEWHPDALIEKLKIARNEGLKTCLYSGFEKVPNRIVQQLDYLKTGRWIEHLGGLDSATTNQVMLDVETGNRLNHRFIQNKIN